MVERLWFYVFTFLLGFSLLGFFHACYREQLTAGGIAARLGLLCAGLLLYLLFAAAFVGAA